jgi:hypothetical protein
MLIIGDKRIREKDWREEEVVLECDVLIVVHAQC